MKKQLIFLALALWFTLGVSQFTHAENNNCKNASLPCVIDDFSAGAHQVTLPSINAASDTSTQMDNTGTHILGGRRTTVFIVCNHFPCTTTENPFAQTATLEIQPKKGGMPAALFVSGGYRTFHLLQAIYGTSANPLQLDLTPFDRLRVSFDGLSQVAGVNLELFSPTGNGSFPCTLGPGLTNNSPFTADFPIKDFVLGTGTEIDLKHISEVALSTDGTSLDYGITKYEAIPRDTPGATFLCPPVGASVAPDFSLTVRPIIFRHVVVAYKVASARINGFSGPVALSCTSAQVTQCEVSPASIAGNGTAILSLSSEFAGSYPVTLTGTSGNLRHSTQVKITVPCSTTPCE